MRLFKARFRRLSKVSVIASFLLAVLISPKVLAIDGALLELFAQNNIIAYDPTCDPSTGQFKFGSYDGVPTLGIESYSEKIDEIHDMVVAFSIEFGIPWELAIAQGIQESQLYKDINGKYNYHGIGASETCGSTTGASNCAFAFASEQDGWYGYFYYMANGHHKSTFTAPTSPLDALVALQNPDNSAGDYIWACSDDDCTGQGYIEKVGGFIKGIQQRSEEKGWDSSADIAAKYPQYLENARKYAAGTKPSDRVINEGSRSKSSPISFPDKPTEMPTASNSSSSNSSSSDSSEDSDSSSSSNSSSSSSSNNSYTWNNGWLKDFPGIKKDDATKAKYKIEDDYSNLEYTTKINDKVGPNKITLHSTEGGFHAGIDDDLYGVDEDGYVYPAHFTIDMKSRTVYQHFPITKPSTAVVEHDSSAGIQIEIMGYSNEALKDQANYDPSYYLYGDGNFSTDDWSYLTNLLQAIAKETDIPLISAVDPATGNAVDWSSASRLSVSSFEKAEGVLGHQHVPDNTHTDPGNIWEKLQQSFTETSTQGSFSTSSVCDVSTDADYESGEDLAALAVEAAWPWRAGESGEEGTCDNGEEWVGYTKSCTTPPKPKYEELYKAGGISGSYQDCGHFVASVIVGGGFDTGLPKSGSGNMTEYLANSDKWEEVANNGTTSNLMPGDVMASDGHIQIYVGSVGSPYGNVASASTGSSPTVGAMSNLGDKGTAYNNSAGKPFRIFRMKSTSSGTLKSGGMTLEEAEAFMQAYVDEAALKKHGTYNFNGATVTDSGSTQGTLNNCSAFTQWFLNKYTTAGPSGAILTQGSQAVSAYLGTNTNSDYAGRKIEGLEDGGKVPRVYAVMSMGPLSGKADGYANHTGIVLGIDESRGKIIIGEASYNTYGMSNGLFWPGAHEYDLSRYMNASSQYAPTYAYTDKILKGL